MLMKCSECGHEVSDKASSCPHCGAQVIGSPTTVAPPAVVGGVTVPTGDQSATASQEPVRRKGIVKCSQCGYEYSFDAANCPKCGSLNGDRLAFLWICGGVVVLIVLCIGLVLGFS